MAKVAETATRARVKALYLESRMHDWQAVFFPEWYLDVKVVQCDLWDAPVPAAARGACQI